MEIRETEYFARWLEGLKDRAARSRILIRIGRLKQGNAGDVKPVGRGVSELRIDYGPGYRIYYFQPGAEIVVLLAGGAKSTQRGDIKKAIELSDIYKRKMK